MKNKSVKSAIKAFRKKVWSFARPMSRNNSLAVVDRFPENIIDSLKEDLINIEEKQLVEIENLAFDLIFYRNYYKDLAAMPDDRALALHFIQFGRDEGRSPNAAALIESLEIEHGPLPADFNANAYRDLHSDLSAKIETWELQEHYLRYGRPEKRAYGNIFSIFAREYAGLKSARIGIAPELAYEQGFESFGSMLEASKLPAGSWLDRFMLYEFALLNADWLPHQPNSRMEGIVMFLHGGIERLAPIALNARFDPSFYRNRVVGRLREASDADLYRDWLSRGIEAGEPCCEAEILRQLLGTDTFPVCFDAEVYRAALPPGTEISSPGRLPALVHYVKSGFADLGTAFTLPDGPEAAALLERIGEYHLARRNLEKAKQAFDAAIAQMPGTSRLHHRRGDTLKLLLRPQEAARDFVIAADAPGSVLWSHIHAAEGLANELGQLDTALDRIVRSAPDFRGDPRWRAAAHAVLDKIFAEASKEASSLYREGHRVDADAHLTTMLDRLVEIIPRIDPLPASLPPSPNSTIVLIANRDLPQCEHYRVEQKRRQLEYGGWTVEIFDQRDADAARKVIDRATAVIFYRVPAFRPIVHTILYAHALGLPAIYEIDDLIFDAAQFPDPLESFEGQITEHDYIGLQYGVPLFRYAMCLCDIGLASTPALADAMRPLVRSGVCHVLRNGLDERNLPFLTRPRPSQRDGAALTVFYGSGTKAHNKDFTDLAAPALLDVLARYPNVRIVIAGYLLLDERFAPFAHRIRELGFTSNVAAYWEVLSGVDINLAVLASTPMADAKSEIKWLEAAMCAVPSIVSATRTYRELLTHGEDALLAATPEEWMHALDQLVRDSDLRQRIGMRARTRAMSAYGLDQAAEVLRCVLPLPVPPEPSSLSSNKDWMTLSAFSGASSHVPRPRRRRRILLVNVYFPPQAVGGATRVVQSNLDQFLDDAGERYEFAVAAVDEHATVPDDPEVPYDTRIDAYRGIPVYRISAPVERNMIWRPFNPRMRKSFEALLDRFEPDLIHFHCVQRLTATVVEIARARAIPYIVTLHDAWWISDFQFLIDENGQFHNPSPDPFVDASDTSISTTESVARRLSLKRTLDGARELLAVSETFAELYRRAGFPRTLTVANGVPRLATPPRRSNWSRRVRLGHIGGRTTHKGATLIEIVLRAGRFPNLALTIVDHAESSSYRRKEVWGETPVEIVGFVPHDRIADLYAQLDVLLAPSLWPESFGLVTREARAAGLWVVASDRGAIGEDIRHEVDGFRISVDGPKELCAVLVRINADHARYQQSPPQPERSVRTMIDQAHDLLTLYDKLFDQARADEQPTLP